jgi:hypothetical protein
MYVAGAVAASAPRLRFDEVYPLSLGRRSE